MNGKGDAPRNCFSEEYRENYERIFRRKQMKTKAERNTIAKQSNLSRELNRRLNTAQALPAPVLLKKGRK